MSKNPKLLRPTIAGDQLNELLIHTSSRPNLHDLHDAVAIVAETGLRSRELTRMAWADIDFDCRQFTVYGGYRGKRRVPFGPTISAVLVGRREHRSGDDLVFGPAPLVTQTRLSRQLRTACRQLNIPHGTFHAIRHLALKRMVAAGVSVFMLCSVAGYRNPFSGHEFRLKGDFHDAF